MGEERRIWNMLGEMDHVMPELDRAKYGTVYADVVAI